MDMIQTTLLEKQLTTTAALRLLVQAGEAGLTATDIAVQFTLPARYWARSNRVSQIMRNLEARGYVRPGRREPTTRYGERDLPGYAGAPVRRWYATEAGAERIAMLDRVAARRAEHERLAAEHEKRRAAALAGVVSELAARTAAGTVTKHWRRTTIAELRQVPCSLQEIGTLFGISRERVRQIEAGREDPCQCGACETP